MSVIISWSLLSAPGDLLDRPDLVLDRLAVLGQLPEQAADLVGDQPADAAQDGRRQQDGQRPPTASAAARAGGAGSPAG